MFLYVLLFVTLLSTASVFAASEQPVDLKNSLEYKKDAGETCNANLYSCSIALNPKDNVFSKLKGEKGQRGDRGEHGFNGPKGEKGQKGDRGELGLNGQKGEQGSTGEAGYPGLPGPAGLPGVQGDKGQKGPGGRCLLVDSMEHYIILERICERNQNEDFLDPDSKIKVFCDKNTKFVCIEIDKNIEVGTIDYPKDMKPFWLGNFSKLYAEANKNIANRILWIRQWSWKMKLKFRYDCYNAAVVNPEKKEGSLFFLSWNDKLIGPEPTDGFPFHYTVQNDQCSNFVESGNVNKWMQADITLEGSTSSLPVTDIYIQNIDEKYEQKFKLRLIEMCFQ